MMTTCVLIVIDVHVFKNIDCIVTTLADYPYMVTSEVGFKNIR